MVALTRISSQHEIARQARLARGIADGQARIATGERLARPSDAPADWARVQRADIRIAAADATFFAIDSGLSRAKAADTALAAMETALGRAGELMVLAGGPAGQGASRDAIAAELAAIRTQIGQLLSQTDDDGAPLFPATAPLMVPAGDGLSLPATGSRSAISDVALAGGPQSLDSILGDAVAALSPGGAGLAAAADKVQAAGAHLSLERARQGLRETALATARTDLEDRLLDVRERRSSLADTDIGAEIIAVQQRMTALDAARASFARLSGRTLFDLLG